MIKKIYYYIDKQKNNIVYIGFDLTKVEIE